MKHLKLKPSDTTVDHRYQRELDPKRVDVMAGAFDMNLMGVPVISQRSDDTFVRIDGQHRLAAACAAGKGDTPILMEVHAGLSIQEEAKLFLRLNGSRKAVGAIDKYRARLEAREPIALEIQTILKSLHCKITKSPQRGGVQAIQSVEWVYHRGNLAQTMRVLVTWLDASPDAFDGSFIKGVSAFLTSYPDANPLHLAQKLDKYAPAQLASQLRRRAQELAPTTNKHADAACQVLQEIYNRGTAKTKRVFRTEPATAHEAETATG